MAEVIGAVNTLGNAKYSITKNALCRTTGTHDHPFWHSAGGLYVNTVQCTVVFDNTVAQAKIKRGEKPTQEEMFNIKRIEIAEDEPLLPPIPFPQVNLHVFILIIHNLRQRLALKPIHRNLRRLSGPLTHPNRKDLPPVIHRQGQHPTLLTGLPICNKNQRLLCPITLRQLLSPLLPLKMPLVAIRHPLKQLRAVYQRRK
ncbi:hypothetical protein NUH16_008221 [Penicillium rubens]|nr:hypothetical protein NUH16_008221 [Penicillium rubens]